MLLHNIGVPLHLCRLFCVHKPSQPCKPKKKQTLTLCPPRVSFLTKSTNLLDMLIVVYSLSSQFQQVPFLEVSGSWIFSQTGRPSLVWQKIQEPLTCKGASFLPTQPICKMFIVVQSLSSQFQQVSITLVGSEWFLNLLPNRQPRLGLAEYSRTTDFWLGFVVLIWIKLTSIRQLWTYI